MNIYASASIPTNTPTVLASYAVPARGGALLNGALVWGDADCEFVVKRNTVTLGGGRTSSSNRTVFIPVSEGLDAKDILILVVTQYEATPQTISCDLMVELL